MKIKMLITSALLVTSANMASAASVMGFDGLWYGNVCRTGAYYSMIPYSVIGTTCWNYGWGTYGTVSGN